MRLKAKYYPLCPCWIEPPNDPEGLMGKCEGTGGDCKYPEKEEMWISCKHLSTGCKGCRYIPCGYRRDIKKTDEISIKKEAIKNIFEQ